MPKENWAIIRDLDPGGPYELRVVTKSDLGESMSLVEQVIAGADPGKLDHRCWEVEPRRARLGWGTAV